MSKTGYKKGDKIKDIADLDFIKAAWYEDKSANVSGAIFVEKLMDYKASFIKKEIEKGHLFEAVRA